MYWIRCPKCGNAISSNSSQCHCGYSLVTKSSPTLTFTNQFELHDWMWFLNKEMRLDKRRNLQLKLRKVAAIATDEAGSSLIETIYRQGCANVEAIQASGVRTIEIRLLSTVSKAPACTLLSILNQLEHIEHPTNTGRWSLHIETPQYRDQLTHMYSYVGLPGYYGLIGGLNDWIAGFKYPCSHEDPTLFTYDVDSATLTLLDGGTPYLPQKCCDAKRVIINAEVGKIPDKLFCNYKCLEEVIISPDIYGIGCGTFANCRALKSVKLPDSIREIGSCAFVGCTELANLQISTTRPLTVGHNAFSLCPIQPTCNSSINAAIDDLVSIQREMENDDISSLMNHLAKPFFVQGKPILVNGTGNWDADFEEAQRRMDMYFSKALFLRQYSAGASIHGEWTYPLTYRYVFSSRVYFHSHDGECVSQTDISIHRISAKRYYSEKKDAISDESYHQQWFPDFVMAMHENEYYFISDYKFRAKNFLGMNGFYEVAFNNS